LLSAGVWIVLISFQKALTPRGIRAIRVHTATMSNEKETW
jgi:hypothetical protein